MTFGEDWQKQQEAEQKEIDDWWMGDYENPKGGCPNCGRSRICKCTNGKHRCEKCNWVIEDKKYCPVD